MEPETPEQYMQKLKESIEINQALLLMENKTLNGLSESNIKFQVVLQQVFEQSQAMLPFFERLTEQLNEEDRDTLVNFASQSTAQHQHFFEIWKVFKTLENETGANLTEAAERIKTFAGE
jgi:hypothetical protein